jgi:hypothetical protein
MFNPTFKKCKKNTWVKVATATNPANRTGGSVDRSDEVILKPNTKYLLRITNLSTSNNDINVGMTWYEH